MANVTDPLARHIHGTNPQNLLEYITRQKIYDTRYWKEECFGLAAVDIAEKAATQLKAVGGSYGGNSQPTRFLCLVLKMLQIQPDDDVVEELVSNEEFKYVRALGAFYLRLTGRPADIYAQLEPLMNDYRPLRRRDVTEWTLTTMDDFVDDLLRSDRVCGIALPRLPKREVLVEGGYLEGPRASAMLQLLEEESARGVEEALAKLARDGNAAAREALVQRGKEELILDDSGQAAAEAGEQEEKKMQSPQNDAAMEEAGEASKMQGDYDNRRSRSRSRSYDRKDGKQDHREGYGDDDDDDHRRDRKKKKKKDHRSGDRKKDKKDKKTKGKKEKNYGTLFKSTTTEKESGESIAQPVATTGGGGVGAEEGSEEYWNAERAKLGLAPLKK